MGLQRAGPVVTSIYEGPLIPVFTMIVVIFTGSKPMPSTLAALCRDIGPLVVACIGAMMVILNKPEGHPHHSHHALHPAGHRRGAPNEHPDGPLSIDGGLHNLDPADYLLGNTFLACVSIGHAIYYALNSVLIQHYSALLISAWSAIITSVTYGMLVVVRVGLGMHSGPGTSVEFLRDYLFIDSELRNTLVFGIVIVQCGAFLIMPWAAKRLSPLAISMFNLSGPGLTAALSHFWLKENIAPPQIIGMIITFVALGVYVILNEATTQEKGNEMTTLDMRAKTPSRPSRS